MVAAGVAGRAGVVARGTGAVAGVGACAAVSQEASAQTTARDVPSRFMMLQVVGMAPILPHSYWTGNSYIRASGHRVIGSSAIGRSPEPRAQSLKRRRYNRELHRRS